MTGQARRVGVIEISSSYRLSEELPGALPPELIAVFSRIRLPGQEVSVAALERMLAGRDLELAAAQLADADVELIAFGCTSASFINGPEGDEEVARRIESSCGVPATTTSTAVVNSLRFLGVQRIGVATPYPEAVNAAERDYLESVGFDVVRIEGLGVATDRELGRVGADEVVRLAMRVGGVPADVLFLSCTNLPSLALLGDLERRLRRPVVSSNSATIWEICRRLGVTSDVLGGEPSRVGGA